MRCTGLRRQIALTRPARVRRLVLASAAPQVCTAWPLRSSVPSARRRTRPRSTSTCSSRHLRRAARRVRRPSGAGTPGRRTGTPRPRRRRAARGTRCRTWQDSVTRRVPRRTRWGVPQEDEKWLCLVRKASHHYAGRLLFGCSEMAMLRFSAMRSFCFRERNGAAGRQRGDDPPRVAPGAGEGA
jgi:pimeloyl-ACP methyl ester carboxylesterase